jgi:hypothetical protein
MSNGFERLARTAAYATAVASVIYRIAFVVVVQRDTSGAESTAVAALTAGGLLALPVLVAITTMLGERAPAPARLALVLGGVATVMTALHGAYDLSALAKPAAATAGDISPVDPRGFSTFALAGVTAIVIAVLARRDERVRVDPERRRRPGRDLDRHVDRPARRARSEVGVAADHDVGCGRTEPARLRWLRAAASGRHPAAARSHGRLTVSQAARLAATRDLDQGSSRVTGAPERADDPPVRTRRVPCEIRARNPRRTR